MLDDALNYLKLRGLDGRHNTVESPLIEAGSNHGSERTNRNRHECLPRSLPDSVSDVLSSNNLQSSAPLSDTEVSTTESTASGDSHRRDRNGQSQLLVWSASDESGLGRLATAYSQYHFTTHDLKNSACFGALARTLAARREQFPWKSFSTAESINDMQKGLETSMSKPVRSNEAPHLGFIFSGQGAAWHGMGRELLAYPVFERSLSLSEEYLQSLDPTVAILGTFSPLVY